MGIEHLPSGSLPPVSHQTEKNNFVRYVILLSHVPNVETTEALIRRHVQYLRGLSEGGHLELCGPFLDFRGGMVILRALSLEEATALASQDPFVKEGARTFEVRIWKLSTESNNHLGMG